MAKVYGLSEQTARELAKLIQKNRRDVDALKRRRRHDVTSFPWYQCWAAKITARSGTTNATYSAEAFNDSSVSVTSATPINRQFSTSDIDYAAASVYDTGTGGPDGVCLIVADHESSYHLIVFETVDITDCGTEAAAVVTPKICYLRDNAGGITATGTTWEEVTWDTEGRFDSSYFTHSTSVNSQDIEIDISGDYKITLELTLECNTSTTFTGAECRLLVDGTEIDGSRSQSYARTGSDDRDRCNMSVTVIASLAAEEVVTAEFKNLDEAIDWETVADGSRIIIEYIDAGT